LEVKILYKALSFSHKVLGMNICTSFLCRWSLYYSIENFKLPCCYRVNWAKMRLRTLSVWWMTSLFNVETLRVAPIDSSIFKGKLECRMSKASWFSRGGIGVILLWERREILFNTRECTEWSAFYIGAHLGGLTWGLAPTPHTTCFLAQKMHLFVQQWEHFGDYLGHRTPSFQA